MAAVTGSKPDKSFIAVLGPFKIEFVHLASVTSGDTYESKLASPQFAVPFEIQVGASPSAVGVCNVSGKTVTITGVDAASEQLLLVFGDDVWS